MGLLTNHWTVNFVDSAALYIEGAWKAAFDFNKKVIRVTSHGNTERLNGNNPKQLTEQIISGKYNTNPSWWQRNGLIMDNSFERMLKAGDDINIELDACNTGAYYKDEKGDIKSFGNEVAMLVKNEVLRRGYKNKVIVKAPNGLSGWNLGFSTVSKPNQSPELNGTIGKINEFIY